MGISSTGFQRPRSGQYTGSANTTSIGSHAALLNITGAGRLVVLATKVPSGSNSYTLIVTVDGVQIQNAGTNIPGTTALQYHIPIEGQYTTSLIHYDLNFKKSLKIEMKATEATYGCNAYWTYELE